MYEINKEEKDILVQIKNNLSAKALFFREARGLKWFFPLQEHGYFKPESLLPSKTSEKTRQDVILLWEVSNYLARTSPELDLEEGAPYRQEFLSIIENVTETAKRRQFVDFQTWIFFTEILSHIPHNIMNNKTIGMVEYWLDDRDNFSLVGKSLGDKVLPKILNQQGENVTYIACKLLSKLMRVSFKTDLYAINEEQRKACLPFDDYYAKKFIESISLKVGERLEKEGVLVFHNGLSRILKQLNNDKYSYLWQFSIGDHEPRPYHTKLENLFVSGYRDSLKGFIQSSPEEAKTHLREMLDSEYATIQRIAIYHIGQEEELYKDLWDLVIEKQFFDINRQYETWYFLKLNYPSFTTLQKEKTLKIIMEIQHKDEDGLSARIRSRWLKAIKNSGEEEKRLYDNEVNSAGEEPEYSDFINQTEVSKAEIILPKSPYTIEELNKMDIPDLVATLNSFESSSVVEAPSVLGLMQTFKDEISSNPLHYFEHLDKFKDIKFAYVCSIIDAYRNLWCEKTELPWDDIWHYLLKYILDVIEQKRFWENVVNQDEIRQLFVNREIDNKDHVVQAITTLIIMGTQSDDHAFDEKYHGKVKTILKILLKNQQGDSFNDKGSMDALTFAINSPRGKCIEALIYVALRHCRLADKKNDEDHTEAWEEFQRFFDRELNRNQGVNYEFIALVPRYISNFLYMSEEWLMKHLEIIFDQRDKKKWRCAVQGYRYTSSLIPKVYQHLKSHGHILNALNDEDLPREYSMKFVRNVVVSFLYDEEDLDDEYGLLCVLLSRGRNDEIQEVIQFILSIREEERPPKFIPKIKELWPRLQKAIEAAISLSSEEKSKLISFLGHWAEFLDYLDDEKELLLEIAPHIHSGSYSGSFLKNLTRLSKQQPFAVNEILQATISEAPYDTHIFLGRKDEVKTILQNLVAKGEEGKRLAQETVSKFAKQGMFWPFDILTKITDNR